MNLTATKEQQPVRPENGRYATWVPPVDVYETKDLYLVRADMAGVTKDGLDITVEGTTLTLVGKRSLPPHAGNERNVEYRRVFELDPMIDYGKVKARIDQGVVTVELPKAEKVKPRKIKIGD